MEFISFASGSSGNCALLREGKTNLLYDAGISMKRIKSSLSELGLELKDISGIIISHEHSDHISGLAMLSKYTDIPVFTGGGTARALIRTLKCEEKNIHIIEPEKTMLLGEIELTAFETPHDAAESFGYTFGCSRGRLAVATDLGCVTRTVERALLGCTAAVIEANHDVEMLRCGAYPRALKMRILGNRGHLSNESCGDLALKLAASGTKSLLLAHLSHENNTPELAYEAVFKRLGNDIELDVAPRDGISVRLEV
ncbi:MAG: MBL fold metallo-hydrolase [Papillibacter sp.]|jgi:phosphoribosyl 1,2-cyclic phosphodiesterase|nr:MBL fold metallo-hydrolase [Papillibacter sp.]